MRWSICTERSELPSRVNGAEQTQTHSNKVASIWEKSVSFKKCLS